MVLKNKKELLIKWRRNASMKTDCFVTAGSEDDWKAV
jgi:hypothetical protein